MTIFTQRIRSESIGQSWIRTSATLGMTAVLLVAAVRCPVSADVMDEQANHRYVELTVSQLLKQEHISRHPIDDAISKRAFDLFIKRLDPLKAFFLKSDVEEFGPYATQFDDAVKRGEITIARTIFKRFLQRVDERMADVKVLLDSENDFSVEESLPIDAKTYDFATTADEAKDRWRKRLKYDLLIHKADKLSLEEAKEKMASRYRSFARRHHQTDGDELLEMFLSSVTESFDPHTTYMAPSSHENFEINMRLNLEGIGAALKPEDGYTVVAKIIPGGAADKLGKLKPEDRIVSVGEGSGGKMVDVVDMKLNDVVKLIRGHAGTVVRLGVQSEGEAETNYFEITRAKIELKDSEARSEVVEYGKRSDGSSVRIGVIDLPSFYMDMDGARVGKPNFKSTTRDVRKILDDFNKNHIDIVVLDLRRNGGGSLTEAINLTGLFVDNGPVVQVKDADGRIQHYDDVESGMAWDGPLVVLTSKFSASASEILAGAIQDYQRGIIVGDDSTHGKGTVQSLLDLGSQLFRVPDPPNLGALKITMQQFYRPNGDSTQQRGVLSDLTLPSLTNHIEGLAEADLDYAVEFDRVPAANYQKNAQVNPEMLTELRARSLTRRESDEGFQKLARNIARYKEQKQRKSVTLNEEKFMKEREELDADKEEEKQFEEQLDYSARPVVEHNYYFDEVLNVAADYVQLLERQRVAQIN